MFKIRLRSDDGEQLEFTATTRDISNWEKTNPGVSLAKLLADLKVSDMYKIAHLAARRQQLHNGTVADFEAKFDIVSELMTVEEEPDPTQQAPSAEPSSPSPSNRASRRASGPKKKNG